MKGSPIQTECAGRTVELWVVHLGGLVYLHRRVDGRDRGPIPLSPAQAERLGRAMGRGKKVRGEK